MRSQQMNAKPHPELADARRALAASCARVTESAARTDGSTMVVPRSLIADAAAALDAGGDAALARRLRRLLIRG